MNHAGREYSDNPNHKSCLFLPLASLLNRLSTGNFQEKVFMSNQALGGSTNEVAFSEYLVFQALRF